MNKKTQLIALSTILLASVACVLPLEDTAPCAPVAEQCNNGGMWSLGNASSKAHGVRADTWWGHLATSTSSGFWDNSEGPLSYFTSPFAPQVHVDSIDMYPAINCAGTPLRALGVSTTCYPDSNDTSYPADANGVRHYQQYIFLGEPDCFQF